MFNKILASPILVRVIPFGVFAILTFFQGRLGDGSQYWMYALKSVVGACLLWLVRPYVKELRWKISWEAIVVGVAVFVAWVGLDGYYPAIAGRTESFNPGLAYGAGSVPALVFAAVRIIGSSLVVPPLERM